MKANESNYVPKVHPASRAIEADDPFSLNATMVEGDPDVMLECLVQDYAWMGWEAAHILSLFQSSHYPALNGLLNLFGEDGVRSRVQVVLDRMGVFRVSGTVRDDPEPDEPETELIQLTVAKPHPAKGDRHAQGL